MNPWIVVLAAGFGTYLLRVSMIGVANLRLPPRFDEAGALVAPSAFAALTVTSIGATLVGSPLIGLVPALVAVAVAVLAVARTGKPYAAPLAGMPTLWLLSALLAS